MQIRRFFAKDMRSALAEVSRELGSDAAILSSRQIGGGVELLAAIDYDPSVLTAPTAREPELATEPAPATSPSRPRPSVKPGVDKSGFSRSESGRSAADNAAFDSQFDAFMASASPAAAAVPAKPPLKAAVRMPAAPRSVKPSRERSSVLNQEHRPETAATSPAVQQDSRVGLNAAERHSLQRDWQQEASAAGGLGDLKEEVRQLRGLMQEQLQGLAWRELKQRQPLRAVLTKRLAMLDLSPRLRDHYAAAEGRDVEQALANALASIARDVVVGDDAMLDHGGIYAFVGATGVGKTTTIAKLAARFALQHGAGSVALISTDSYRIAGHDQLATYARLIGCAIRTADNAASLQDALDSFVDRRLILIDTAGMSQRDARLADQLTALASSRYPVKQLLVLSATAQRAILQESIKQFGQCRVHGAILTKLDETTSLGAVLSVLLESRLPLMASGDGQRVPEDLRSLRGAQLIDRALKLAEQFRESPDEWRLAQELPALRTKATAHAGI